jgi:hypothetical protein
MPSHPVAADVMRLILSRRVLLFSCMHAIVPQSNDTAASLLTPAAVSGRPGVKGNELRI